MKSTRHSTRPNGFYRARQWMVLALVGLGMAVLTGRAFQVQILDSSRLQSEGAARQLRSIAVTPARGRIIDRNGDVLAVNNASSGRCHCNATHY